MAAVGDAGLRSRLPKGLLAVLEADGQRVSKVSPLVELALAVYGIDALRAYRSELRDQGLDPPSQWAGSPAALSFVRRLGFPRDYAGFEQPGRSPLLEVEGPPTYPISILTSSRSSMSFGAYYAAKEKADVRSCPCRPVPEKRASRSKRSSRHSKTTNWPGRSCGSLKATSSASRQIQTWSFVWRGEGPSRERFAVSHLGQKTKQSQSKAGHQVVVATIQKLGAGCYDDPEYEWLAECGVRRHRRGTPLDHTFVQRSAAVAGACKGKRAPGRW